MLDIGNVAVIQLPCSCYEFLRKLYSQYNIIQDKYNQDQYKGENWQYVFWPILGIYNNWKIIYCIDIKNNTKQTIIT